MIASELAEVVRIGLVGHPMIRDVQPMPSSAYDRAALAVSDTDSLLWTIAVFPRETS